MQIAFGIIVILIGAVVFDNFSLWGLVICVIGLLLIIGAEHGVWLSFDFREGDKRKKASGLADGTSGGDCGGDGGD